MVRYIPRQKLLKAHIIPLFSKIISSNKLQKKNPFSLNYFAVWK